MVGFLGEAISTSSPKMLVIKHVSHRIYLCKPLVCSILIEEILFVGN